jgi:hypothetical protein
MIGIVFETATPFDTSQRMTELVAWLNQARELRRLYPLLSVAVFIVVFLAMHSFQDGNGRLSRILTTLLLFRARHQKTLRPDLMKFLMPIYFLEHSGKPSMMPETAFLRSSSYQNSQLAIV